MSSQTPTPGQFPAPQPMGQAPQGYAAQLQALAAPVPAKRPYRKGLVAAAAASLVAGVAAVSVAGYMTFAHNSTGASSPEELVSSLDAAIEKSDLVALSGLISPADMANAVEVQDVVGDLFKVDELVGTDALRAYGKHIVVHDNTLETSVEKYTDDLAKININTWKIDLEVKSELGNELAERWRAARGDKITPMENLALSQVGQEFKSERTQIDVVNEATNSGAALALMAVREDGRWYVSPSLSQDESTAASSGIVPNYQADYLNIKSDAGNPEEAVQRFVEALTKVSQPQDFAAEDVIRYLPLAERRRAAIYGASALEQLSETVAKPNFGDAHGVEEMISALNGAEITWALTSTEVDGGAIVSPGTTVVDFKGGFPGKRGAYRLQYDGAAITATEDGVREGGIDLNDRVAHPERFGIFTVQEDGGWRISATSSALNLFTLGASESTLASVGSLMGDADPSLSLILGSADKLVEIGRGSPLVGTLIAFFDAMAELNSPNL